MAHLDNLDESYVQHAREGIRLSTKLFLASIACLIHSFFPELFEQTASKTMSTELQRFKNRLTNTSHIQVRYNTKVGDGNLFWRVIVDGKESLASTVVIFGTIYGEESATKEGRKLNMACDGIATWDNDMVVIEA
jgi:hypothetical protein